MSGILVPELQEHSGRLVEGEPTYGVDADWKTIIRELPCRWQEVSGGENVRGRQMEATTTSLLTCRWSPETRAIKSKNYRLKIGSRILNIVSAVDRKGNCREIEIQASEVK